MKRISVILGIIICLFISCTSCSNENVGNEVSNRIDSIYSIVEQQKKEISNLESKLTKLDKIVTSLDTENKTNDNNSWTFRRKDTINFNFPIILILLAISVIVLGIFVIIGYRKIRIEIDKIYCKISHEGREKLEKKNSNGNHSCWNINDIKEMRIDIDYIKKTIGLDKLKIENLLNEISNIKNAYASIDRYNCTKKKSDTSIEPINYKINHNEIVKEQVIEEATVEENLNRRNDYPALGYLKTANEDGVFQRVSSSAAGKYFKLYNKVGEKANFILTAEFSDIKEDIDAILSTSVCEILSNTGNATSVDVFEEGELISQGEDEWKVIRKLKVNIK